VDVQSERLAEEGMRLLPRQTGGEAQPGDGHVAIEPRLVMRDATRARGKPAAPAPRSKASKRLR